MTRNARIKTALDLLDKLAEGHKVSADVHTAVTRQLDSGDAAYAGMVGMATSHYRWAADAMEAKDAIQALAADVEELRVTAERASELRREGRTDDALYLLLGPDEDAS